MKVFVLLAVCFVYASAFQFTAEWEMWKKTHGKEYTSDEEEQHRHTVWESNKVYVINHNARKLSWTLEMNKFADLESSEFAQLYNGYRGSERTHTSAFRGFYVRPEGEQLNATVDWRPKGAVTAVKNQKQCGSCWAFSTTGSLEGQTFLKKGTLPSLSEQQLVDCDKKKDHGCQGGLMDNAFQYIEQNGGIDSESSYPYEAKNDKCRFSSSNVAATVSGYKDIRRGDIDGLMSAVANIGPISVAMDASHSSFQLYAEGVYDPFFCSSSRLDHGVLAVGYGTEPAGIFKKETDYWLVKNSWGAVWGDHGYFKIARKNNKCGIATSASYPLV